jgi:ligand-binding sensor domain-containing protein
MLLSRFSVAQPEIIRFDRFSDEEGLPNNLFTQVIQDKHGVMWMAGIDGLASFDGYTIRAYRHSFSDSTSISGNKASMIYEDSKGRLWVGVLGAELNVSDQSKTKFQRIKFPLPEQERLAIRVSSMTEDSLNRIWMTSAFGLFVLEDSADAFTFVPLGRIIPGADTIQALQKPTVLYTDWSGKVWIGTSAGLFVYEPAASRLWRPQEMRGLPPVAIYDIEPDRENRIWVSAKVAGARLFHANREQFVFSSFDGIPFREKPTSIQIAFDLDNRLWALVFGDQAYGYDLKDSSLFLQSTINSDIAHERFFRKPFVDHSGNTWLPVEGFYIHRYPKGFNTFFHPYAFHQSNTCVYETEHYLWFGFREKGIVREDKRDGTVIRFASEEGADKLIPADHIADILQAKSGNLILVAFNQITVMTEDGKVVASYKVGGTNRAAFQDRKGRIWIGGYSGLHLFSESQGVLETYKPPALNEHAGHYVQTIVEDADGLLWFASDLRGLTRFDPESKEMKSFMPVEGDSLSMPSFSVLDIDVDQNNILWVATDVALVRFDPRTFKVQSYDNGDGLQNDYISSVACVPDGRIWFSTHAGISVLDPLTHKVINYGEKDGLSNFSYYTRSKHVSRNGSLYFGGKNGVDYFNPAHLRSNPTAPIMFLSALDIQHGEQISGYDKQGFSPALELSYRDKVLEIEITGVHFASQQDVQYEYKMEGLQDEWIKLGKQRNVLFSNLQPGKYVFHARAISGDGVWSEKDLLIPIHIKPPFYATAWFRLMATILLLGLLSFIIRYRELSIKRKDKAEAEVNQKMVELERRALQAQMNPHFIYNSMNSIQQFMIMHDMEGAMKYLTKFSRILRTVLNISAQNRIPLTDEITLIQDYLELENMRFPDKFTYDIYVSPDINTHTVEIPPFFIQPQVENAIRHGLLRKTTPGHLRIEITADEEHLFVVVEDNGIGREASQHAKKGETVMHESKGLAIVEERLSHLHSANGFKPFKIIDLYDAAHRPSGTRVEIILPLD